MFKVKIITTGKSKESWLNAALQEYEKRLSPYMQVSWLLLKNSEKILSYIKDAICLDPNGKMFSSEKFAEKLFSELKEGYSSLSFVIGGPEGIPKEALQEAKAIWSLSLMTFTHQMTRIILLEQLYRSIQIEKGRNYHK